MKEGYKKTELDWIPESWNLIRIGELVKILKSGLSRSLKEENIGIPCIRANNIKNNRLVLDDLKYWMRVDNKGAKIEDYILDEGDIIINFINSISQIGKGCIFDRNDFETIYTTNLLRIKVNENKINNKYFYYYTQTERYKKEISLITKPAVNQASFTTVEYKAIKFLVPPLKEQEKIADILSTVDYQIDDTDKLIEKTKKLKKGLMQRLLTKGIGHKKFKKTEVGEIPVEWEVGMLSSIIDKDRKITYGIVQPGEYYDGGIYVIRAKDYSFGWVNNDEIFRCSELIDKSYARSKVKEGDVLLTIVGSVGNIAIVPNRLEGANITQQTARLSFDIDKANNNYYYYYLKSTNAIKEMSRYMKNGVQPSLNLSDIEKFKVVIPPINEQKKISDILSSVDMQIEEYENKKMKLEELKKGLMQQLLTGKIRV